MRKKRKRVGRRRAKRWLHLRRTCSQKSSQPVPWVLQQLLRRRVLLPGQRAGEALRAHLTHRLGWLLRPRQQRWLLVLVLPSLQGLQLPAVPQEAVACPLLQFLRQAQQPAQSPLCQVSLQAKGCQSRQRCARWQPLTRPPPASPGRHQPVGPPAQHPGGRVGRHRQEQLQAAPPPAGWETGALPRGLR